MARNHKNLDRPLDDMIRSRPSNNNSGSFGNGRPANQQPFSSSASGPDRVRYRPAPYSVSQVEARMWRGVGAAGGGGEAEAKLYISNLDSRVTNRDLQILFSELGELKDHSVHYDMGGRSLGTAEVVYMRRADAEAALNRYNDVKLDGKRMKIEFVGVNVVTSYHLSPFTISEVPGNSRGIREIREERARARRGGGRGPNHDGWGMRRNQNQQMQAGKVTAAELDADLDEYKMSTASGSR